MEPALSAAQLDRLVGRSLLPFDVPARFDVRWARKVIPRINELDLKQLHALAGVLREQWTCQEQLQIVELKIRQWDEPDERDDDGELCGTLNNGTGGGYRVIRSTRGMS